MLPPEELVRVWFSVRRNIAVVTSGMVVFVEVELSDASEFQHKPTLQIKQEEGKYILRITDAASIATFADEIAAAHRRLYGGGTSISGAIDYAASLFARSLFTGGRRVIDISGDGANNRGRPAEAARDEAIKAGIVINGLPILELEPDLEEFYRRNVIGGPNAFVIPVARFEEFGDAVLKKLILEIAEPAGFRRKFGRLR